MRVAPRQVEMHASPHPHLGVDAKCAVHPGSHEVVDNCHPQPGPAPTAPGGEEGVQDVVEVTLRNPDAAIGDRHIQTVAAACLRRCGSTIHLGLRRTVCRCFPRPATLEPFSRYSLVVVVLPVGIV